MKDLRKAAERLLEALDDGWVQRDDWAAFELRQALAQPEQEPVAWEKSYDIVCALLRQAHDILATTQYPIKRPWVGLTEDESSDIYNAHHNTYSECITSAYELVLDVEAALRSKNNG